MPKITPTTHTAPTHPETPAPPASTVAAATQAARATTHGPTRLAAVSYLNTRPLISGLENENSIQLASRPPASVIDLLRPSQGYDGGAGDQPLVDLALVSMVDVLRSGGALTLVPASMIASDGPTHTVRLYSRVSLGQVRAVHVDPESHTSVLLARLLIKEHTGHDPALVPLASGAVESGEPEAVLLIGDKVVTHPPDAGAYPHQLDLGAAWRDLTGLPFVYAVWACRTSDADPSHADHDAEALHRVRRGALLLDRQRRHNATRIDWIVERTAVVHGWPADAARHYVGALLRYTVDHRARAGVAEFVRRLHDLEPGTFTEPIWGDAVLSGGLHSASASLG